MSLISLRLPDDLTALLNQEAKLSKRAKAEIARTAIADYLRKQERDRFIAEYVKSAMDRDPTDSRRGRATPNPRRGNAVDEQTGRH